MRRKLLKSFVAAAAMVSVLSIGMEVCAAGTYTVEKNDYLRKISKQVYGTTEQWRVIYEANQGIIKNPNLIYKGQVLVIPDLPGAGNEIIPVPSVPVDPNAAPAEEITAPGANTTETAPAPEPTPAPAPAGGDPNPYLNWDEG